jgi:hypothetical protein
MGGRTASGLPNQTDGWVIKLDRNFDVQWFRILSGESADEITDIAVTQNGAYVAAGWVTASDGERRGWAIKINPSGATAWESVHDLGSNTIFQCVLGTDEENVVFVANVVPLDSSENKIVIGGLGPDGLRTWDRGITAEGRAVANDLIRRSDGLLIAAASVDDSNGRDGLVIGFTTDGVIKSILRHGGPRNSQALAISHAGLDSYAVAGVSADLENNNQDMWLVIGREIMQSAPSSPKSEP